MTEIEELFKGFKRNYYDNSYDITDEQLATSILKNYYTKYRDDEKISEMVIFLFHNNLQHLLNCLIDIGFNPFKYYYKIVSKYGTNVYNFISLNCVYHRLGQFYQFKQINNFKQDISDIINDHIFFDTDGCYIFYQNQSRKDLDKFSDVLFKFIDLLHDKDIIFNKILDIIIKRYEEYLEIYLNKLYDVYIVSNPDKYVLTFNQDSFNQLCNNYLKDESRDYMRLYSLLIKFDSNFDFNNVNPKYMYFGYIKQLESKNNKLETCIKGMEARITELENAILYSPDNQDENAPIKTAKNHYESLSGKYSSKLGSFSCDRKGQ